jgi:hypothetical protein
VAQAAAVVVLLVLVPRQPRAARAPGPDAARQLPCSTPTVWARQRPRVPAPPRATPPAAAQWPSRTAQAVVLPARPKKPQASQFAQNQPAAADWFANMPRHT